MLGLKTWVDAAKKMCDARAFQHRTTIAQVMHSARSADRLPVMQEIETMADASARIGALLRLKKELEALRELRDQDPQLLRGLTIAIVGEEAAEFTLALRDMVHP